MDSYVKSGIYYDIMHSTKFPYKVQTPVLDS